LATGQSRTEDVKIKANARLSMASLVNLVVAQAPRTDQADSDATQGIPHMPAHAHFARRIHHAPKEACQFTGTTSSLLSPDTNTAESSRLLVIATGACEPPAPFAESGRVTVLSNG
jgi:hypothetical protein